MKPKVIGAGVGRTGTYSLKLALERLLGGACYHMVEVFQNPDHIPAWHQAALDNPADMIDIIGRYEAAVDWPVASFWRELSEAYPESLIVVSDRDPDDWWQSVQATIFRPENEERMNDMEAWGAMIRAVLDSRFTLDIANKESCLAAYAKHYEEVRRDAPKSRTIEWRAVDGWTPLCDALGVPIPDEPFPKANTREEFLKRFAQAGDEVGAGEH